jgi:hypothetical protein
LQARELAALSLSTPGGRFQVRWDEGGSTTALGQLAFFAEFIEVTGLFERWMERCRMAFIIPSARGWSMLLGTWMPSTVDGQRCRVHATGLGGDKVAPQIFGMNKIISDDSLCRALAHLAPNQPQRCSDDERAARAAQLKRSTAWMDGALAESIQEALTSPCILDCDTTSKSCTVITTVPRSATTRRSRGDPATCCTPNGAVTYAWCWKSKSRMAHAPLLVMVGHRTRKAKLVKEYVAHWHSTNGTCNWSTFLAVLFDRTARSRFRAMEDRGWPNNRRTLRNL